jgi:Popeye protein conserved region
MELISSPTGTIINVHSAVWWITIANILYLASYSVHDILWLRILTVVAAALLIPYYALQPVPLLDAIGWNALFIAINIYWIIRLMIERRPVYLTPDEARLRVLSFPSLTPREARDLYAMGSWDDVAPGTSLVSHDNAQGWFSVILRGVADVMHRGIKITELGEGQFVGGIDVQAASNVDIDVLVRLRARVMCFPRKQLQAFLSNRPDVDLALERSVGLEVRRLLDVSLSKLDGA